ncbi:MAG: glutamate--tRNA ligase [Chloroflexi bacterium]|nr:glutamate--tRNA ligase [Chloroflexota bacterium]
MSTPVRVRYAPSPTGNPHIGNIRTAMFNWLFARRHGGQFIVRVEDTDQARIEEGAVEHILNGLEWLGIDWDEGPRVGGPYGPYFQSERLETYDAAAERLIASGNAYRCYCTPERVAELRKEQARNKQRQGYDSHCRDLSDSEREANEAAGLPHVVRFAMPQSGMTTLEDAIRGHVEWQNELTDDFVLIKSDGFPTYHLAVTVDDYAMQISHVLRAEEWLPSAARHVQLYRALDFPMPQFGHLPMILGSDRAKLSKRHGATSLMEYRDDGFVPDALINFMALLGWSLDGETEIMTVDTIRDNFALERVGKPAAIFDLDKLQWMNGVYIRQMGIGDLADQIVPFLETNYPEDLLPVDREYLLRIVPLVQERLKTLADAPDMLSYFFEDELQFDAESVIQRGMDTSGTVGALRRAISELSAVGEPDFEHQHLESLLRSAGTELELSGRQFFGALRTAITGRTATPPLFEMMEVMGKERVLKRLAAAAENLSAD